MRVLKLRIYDKIESYKTKLPTCHPTQTITSQSIHAAYRFEIALKIENKEERGRRWRERK